MTAIICADILFFTLIIGADYLFRGIIQTIIGAGILGDCIYERGFYHAYIRNDFFCIVVLPYALLLIQLIT